MATGDPFSAGQPLSAMRSIASYQTSSSEASVSAKNNIDRFAFNFRGASEHGLFSKADASFVSSPWAKIRYTILELRVLRDKLPQVVCNLLAMKDSAGGICYTVILC